MIKMTQLARVLSVSLGLPGALSAQAQTSAWVSSEKDNTIALVDLAQGRVTGTVPTCKRPRHMQLSLDRKQMLVACSDSNALISIPVGRVPHTVVLTN